MSMLDRFLLFRVHDQFLAGPPLCTVSQIFLFGQTNYRKTPQDTARHPQDTARHCKTPTRHRMQGYYKYSGMWWWWGWGGLGEGGGSWLMMSQINFGHFFQSFVFFTIRAKMQ